MKPTGRILYQVVGSARRSPSSRRQSSVAIPGMDNTVVTDNEADEMEEHLRGLGYIE